MDFGGALDRYFDRMLGMEEQRETADDRRSDRIDQIKAEIADDKQLFDEAFSNAVTSDGPHETEWDRQWYVENRRLLRAMVKSDTSEMLEAAQGIAELMDEAITDLAEKRIDKEEAA